MRKLRDREFEQIAQGHRAGNRWSQDLNLWLQDLCFQLVGYEMIRKKQREKEILCIIMVKNVHFGISTASDKIQMPLLPS